MLAFDLDAFAEHGRAALAAREAAGLPARRELAGDLLAEQRAAHAREWAEASARHNEGER